MALHVHGRRLSGSSCRCSGRNGASTSQMAEKRRPNQTAHPQILGVRVACPRASAPLKRLGSCVDGGVWTDAKMDGWACASAQDRTQAKCACAVKGANETAGWVPCGVSAMWSECHVEWVSCGVSVMWSGCPRSHRVELHSVVSIAVSSAGRPRHSSIRQRARST